MLGELGYVAGGLADRASVVTECGTEREDAEEHTCDGDQQPENAEERARQPSQ
jgi:hypothetical protein